MVKHSLRNRPCYIGLKNNVATRLLETTLNKFPSGTPDFVSHSVLKDYIQDTAARTEVDAVTRYNTEVQNLTKQGEKWAVRTATLQTHDGGTRYLNTSTSVRIVPVIITVKTNLSPDLRRHSRSIRALPRGPRPLHPRTRSLETHLPQPGPTLERLPQARRLQGQELPPDRRLRILHRHRARAGTDCGYNLPIAPQRPIRPSRLIAP